VASPKILRKEPSFGADVAPATGSTPMERMYFAWNDALARNDPAALLSLYAEDAVLESPLVAHLLKQKSGVLRGRRELKPLFDMVALRKPKVQHPREGEKGEQMDFAEVMELNEEGLIQRHCVYWGWFGVGILQRDEYRQ